MGPNGIKVGCDGEAISDKALRYLVAYAIDMVLVNRDAIIEQLTQIIREVLSESRREQPTDRIESQIQALQKKKMQIIDLAADGLISKRDLKERNDLYTAQIEEWMEKLHLAERAAEVSRGQARQLNQYVERMKELTQEIEESDEILRDMLKKAVVYNGKRVDLYLEIIPFCIRIRYKTSGRLEQFTTTILSSEIVDSDMHF